MSDHYDPNHALNHYEIHAAHVYSPYHRHETPKDARTRWGWNLGWMTGVGIAVATGMTGGVAPLIMLGGGLLGGAIGEATYKDKDK